MKVDTLQATSDFQTAATPLQSRKGHSGMLPVSTPEATALDLVRYSRHIGGLDAVLTVLSELAESRIARGAQGGDRRHHKLSIMMNPTGKIELYKGNAFSITGEIPDKLREYLHTKVEPSVEYLREAQKELPTFGDRFNKAVRIPIL